jgi:molecular chaperone GrpE
MESETLRQDAATQHSGATGDTPLTGPDTIVVEDAAAQLAMLAAERDQLATERAALHDRLMRLAAEFENFRRRTERERQELAEFAGAEAVRAVLPVLDDFERALTAQSPDAEYARGMELIYQRLAATLRQLGVVPIEAEGKPFDPNLHYAVERVETTEVADDTVLADLQRGYHFKSRLLRPTMVRVAVRPA